MITDKPPKPLKNEHKGMAIKEFKLDKIFKPCVHSNKPKTKPFAKFISFSIKVKKLIKGFKIPKEKSRFEKI